MSSAAGFSLADDDKLQYLADLRKHCSAGRLLEIGCGTGRFVEAARAAGFDAYGQETDSALAKAARLRLGDDKITSANLSTLEPQAFDAIASFGNLAGSAEPVGTLGNLRRLLKEDGILLVSVPIASSSHRAGETLLACHPKQLSLFDRYNLLNALFKAGFDRSLIVNAADPNNPPVRSFFTSVTVVARTRQMRVRPILSVIVPVYNERATFRELMDRLLNKQVRGLDKEIVVVESNSTDGTRADVLSYAETPGVRIILQDQAKGKGNAVRAGLTAARGEFVLIQDADLEYDINDYDLLLRPLLACEQAFVIGSRHGANGWKIRQFTDQKLIGSFVNFGHLLFLTMFNVLYRQRLKDPFSMFKVFRRECLYGLEFQCDRFDFDFELVIKLLRKGYQPVEIPINYTARSWKAGKKVSAWRDPLTWLKALLRFRFQKLAIDSNQMEAMNWNRPARDMASSEPPGTTSQAA
jgi:glycosyltransferase involved in cell wall biosynthesis